MKKRWILLAMAAVGVAGSLVVVLLPSPSERPGTADGPGRVDAAGQAPLSPTADPGSPATDPPTDGPPPDTAGPPGGQPPPSAPPAPPGVRPTPPSPTPSTSRPTTSPASGQVYFQNRGTAQGWSNYPQQPQKHGIVRTVTSPSYRGETSIEAQQTYLDGQGGGYHSETIEAAAEKVGEDRYFGQAIYVRPDWTFHSQNVTFQQFSPEDPAGPWLLMFIQGDQLRYAGHAVGSGLIAPMTDLRGTWIRIVTRLKLTQSGGAFEVWVNGRRMVRRTGDIVPPGRTIRWSSGIYCTGWRDGLPTGPHVLSVFHAHARIASSYPLAEPANW